MAFTVVLSDIPKTLVIGNSVSWRQSLADFPASSWTLTYALVNSSGQITITASADSDTHLVEVSPATSTNYTAGEYAYQAYVEKSDSSERYKIGEGLIKILTDFESETSGYDARSWVKKTLDYVESLITGKVQKDRASYSIAGRSLSSYSWDEIYTLRENLVAQYRAEERLKNKRSSTVKVRFS